MILRCRVCAAVSSVEMGFWVRGYGGGSSRARYYWQVRRAKRGSRTRTMHYNSSSSIDGVNSYHTARVRG